MDNYFNKQPNESFTISIDFSNNFTGNEIIDSCVATAYLNNTDVSSTIIDNNSTTDEKLYIKVKNGISGLDYKLTAIVTTTDDNTFEEDILMRVREI